MSDAKQPESDAQRVEYRAELAQIMSENGMSNVAVLTRETVSELGISEWKLIEALEAAEDDTVTTGVGDDMSAAKRLAKRDIVSVTQSEDDDEGLVVTKKHKHVVIPLFEDNPTNNPPNIESDGQE